MQTHLRRVILAKGPWKQVAVVETFAEMGDGLYGVGTPPPDYHPILPNGNIVAFLDDKRVLIADGAHPIRVCDADSGAILRSFGEPLAGTYEHRTIALSPGGRLITILPADAPKIWDTVEGRLVGTLSLPATFAVFQPDGRRMATCDAPGVDGVSIYGLQGQISALWAAGSDLNVG